MAKFLSRLFGRGSSFRDSQSSLDNTHSRSKTSSSVRTSGSLENLASYHVVSKELEKNKLHKASWEGNLHKVQRFARPGQINIKDQHMRTPIHLAVVKGHLDVVRYLVQENAKLDLIDNEQRTPLIKAVLSGNQNPQQNYKICQVLMNGGAGDSVNVVDKHGKSALHYAIDFGNQDLVELFLSHENCNPNLQDRDQMTPLHLAIKRNNPQIVQSLLSDQHEQQADPNMINRYGQTPLHLAASVGYVDIVRLLLLSNLEEPCDPTILDSQQITAYEAAKANHQETCAKLIEEYQQKQSKSNFRRQTTTSIAEPLSFKGPAANLQHNRDETSEDSSPVSTTNRSKSSPRRLTQRPSDQWSDDIPSISEPKLGTHHIQSLFQTNPLQPDETKKNTSSTLNELFNHNPLQTKTTPKSQHIESTLFSGIGPVIERVDSDNTSASLLIDKSLKLVPQVSQTKPTTLLQPVSSAKSWSDDTITASPVKKQEPKSNSWDTSISDDDDPTISKQKKPSKNLHKTQPFSPAIIDVTSSDTDDDNSIGTKVRRLDLAKPSNETVANSYKVIGVSEVQSPVSEDSSWTTSPVPFNQDLPTNAVQNLVQQIKADDSTWDDDSRPISIDLSKGQTTGIENLTKIIDTIMHSTKTQTSPKIVGKLLVSSMINRTDSISSETESKSAQLLPSSTKHDSKSSFNDARINELKESIKKLERDQDDARELKRQLRDMENQKDNFEKLYKENDQILRDIEIQFEREKHEKQRLESTTTNLNAELKTIREQLRSLEDEKEFLNQRFIQLKDERDNSSAMQRNNSHDEDVEKIRSQYQEKMKSLTAENDHLHHRTKQLQSDLEFHRESFDVAKQYKTDSEQVAEEKSQFQREFNRLKSEKDRLEEEKLEYKTKYDSLQDEIRLILFDRSKLEQKLTGELQEHLQEKQRSTGDLKKYRTQIEQLNIQLGDAEDRLGVLQTQNQTLLISKDRDIKHEFESLTQRLNQIDSEKSDYHQAITSKHNLHEPLSILTAPVHRSNSALHPQSEQNYDLNKTFPQLFNHNENYLVRNSRQIRSETERVKSELDRLRQEFDQLVSDYEPANNFHQQTQIRSQIDIFRQFYEQEFRQRQLLKSSTSKHNETTSANSRYWKERLDTTIDSHLQTVVQLPRQTSALLTVNSTTNGLVSSIGLFRKHSHV